MISKAAGCSTRVWWLTLSVGFRPAWNELGPHKLDHNSNVLIAQAVENQITEHRNDLRLETSSQPQVIYYLRKEKVRVTELLYSRCAEGEARGKQRGWGGVTCSSSARLATSSQKRSTTAAATPVSMAAPASRSSGLSVHMVLLLDWMDYGSVPVPLSPFHVLQLNCLPFMFCFTPHEKKYLFWNNHMNYVDQTVLLLYYSACSLSWTEPASTVVKIILNNNKKTQLVSQTCTLGYSL